jgi:hypothetical protein
VSVTTVNHADLAVSRLTGLYRDKVKWVTLLRQIAGSFDDLEAFLPILAQLDDVDAKGPDGQYLNRGVVLDVTGARYGQPRRMTGAVPLLYFGWDEDDDALGWGEEDDELTGGSWYEDGQPLTVDALMDDATYRVAIRMRRVKNGTKLPNFETYVAALLHIFPDLLDLGQYALVLEEVAGAVLLGIGRQPTALETALLRYSGAFPKLGGVKLEACWWPAGSPVFGFDDDVDPDAAGWGEEDNPDAGGVFAEEF